MKVLVTGAAGFIGMHCSKKLIEEGYQVVGIDNMNSYYSVRLKRDRLQAIAHSRFRFLEMDIRDAEAILHLFKTEKFDYVLHLAAMAGVRHSLSAPDIYVETNINGFLHILEACRHIPPKHLVYASSSSVYGLNKALPFSEKQSTAHPISLYAATKKSNELMAHSYSYLFGLPTTGLRFFTAIGPWGRPDMALFLFTKSIIEGKPITVYNKGDMDRNFTYIHDLVTHVIALMGIVPKRDETFNAHIPTPYKSEAPYKIFNIGSKKSIHLLKYIEIVESILKKKAIKKFVSMQKGDIQSAQVDNSLVKDYVDFPSYTPIEVAISEFVKWYKAYYKK